MRFDVYWTCAVGQSYHLLITLPATAVARDMLIEAAQFDAAHLAAYGYVLKS